MSFQHQRYCLGSPITLVKLSFELDHLGLVIKTSSTWHSTFLCSAYKGRVVGGILAQMRETSSWSVIMNCFHCWGLSLQTRIFFPSSPYFSIFIFGGGGGCGRNFAVRTLDSGPVLFWIETSLFSYVICCVRYKTCSPISWHFLMCL